MTSKLTFFCELDTAVLPDLFSDQHVIEDLRTLSAGVSLGLRDLSEERAVIVQRLNAAGIPVVAWLLLPEAQGYWFNLDNAPEAIAFYADFRAWTAAHGLQWDGVGLDIEPDMREMKKLIAGDRRALATLLRRFLNVKRFKRAREHYAALIAQIRADGYRVDEYAIPFVVDERRTGSQLVQRLLGLVDLAVDREVLMLYSSFMRPFGHGLLWSYAPSAESVAVGSTGGGVTVGGVDRFRRSPGTSSAATCVWPACGATPSTSSVWKAQFVKGICTGCSRLIGRCRRSRRCANFGRLSARARFCVAFCGPACIRALSSPEWRPCSG